jgi:hypothetical protein
MTTKGLRTAIILIIIILILVILVVILRSLYTAPVSKYGTWSDFSTTFCLNNGQGCSVSGTQQRYRTCTPNPTTGLGCIDSKGIQTFNMEYIDETCTPVCYSAVWSDNSTSDCSVYTDVTGTTLASSQSCRNPNQFSYIKIERQCVGQDSTGINACLKADNTVANLGEIETLLIPCTTVPDCYEGEWQACGSTSEVKDCGGIDTDCGRILLDSTPARCYKNIAGVPTEVASTECYPPDDPGPCPINCFNYPCVAYPPDYSNISSFISDNSQIVFVEIQDSTTLDKIEADYNVSQAQAASNNQDVFPFAPGYVATIFGNTGNVVRFQLVPSQAEAANGAFYLFATLPGNGQTGIVRYSLVDSRLEIIPQTVPQNLGETLDDVIPRPDLFSFTGTGPYSLNLYTLPGPVLLNLFCVADCLLLNSCDCPCGICNGICGTC